MLGRLLVLLSSFLLVHTIFVAICANFSFYTNHSLMTRFISPLINTITFIYQWILATAIPIINITMVATPRKKKYQNGDDDNYDDGDDVTGRRTNNDKKLSPLSNKPHLWDSPPAGGDGSSTKRKRRSISFFDESPQRKLFDLDDAECEDNVENGDEIGSKQQTQKKKNCTKGIVKAKDKNKMKGKSSSSSSNPTHAPANSATISIGPRVSPRRRVSSPRNTADSQNHHPSLSTAKSELPDSPSSSPEKSTTLSPMKDHHHPMSPLHPPSTIRAANKHNNNNHTKDDYDYTLTPTVLYNGNRKEPMSACTLSSQYYHQSPHWSGQVRVNPFSPIPEQYLRPPPTSTQSVSRGSRKQQRRNNNHHSGFYNLFDLEDAPSLKLQTTTNMSHDSELPLIPRQKKSRLNPSPSKTQFKVDDNSQLAKEISPKDITPVSHDMFDTRQLLSGHKRRNSLPQSSIMGDMDAPYNVNLAPSSNKRMRTNECGRYLSDFQEVQFLGAGSFGSVNACLSRLDGCTYAVKSISPTGQNKMGNNNGMGNGANMEGSVNNYLYGGRRMMSNQCAVPPTPRSDLCPARKTMSRMFGSKTTHYEDHDWDASHDLGMLEGSTYWNDAALRRMLREVFALAALCQQDDFRTFHIVRYQQAWLEDDGTLYIQTELCSATLRDEMSGGKKVSSAERETTSSTTGQTISVSRQLKLLREILLALELVHQQGMVHLDIKPENIFVKNDKYKLGDFGMANSFSKNGMKSSDIEEGDSRYMSKDLLDFCPKDLTKCDIFSLGVTMYEVCSGGTLPTCGEEWQGLRNGKVVIGLEDTSLGDIIKEMMHQDTNKRPSATELLSRDILRSTNDMTSLYKVTKSV